MLTNRKQQPISCHKQKQLLEAAELFQKALLYTIIKAPGHHTPLTIDIDEELFKFIHKQTKTKIPKLHTCNGKTRTHNAFLETTCDCKINELDQDLIELIKEHQEHIPYGEIRTTLNEALLPLSKLLDKYANKPHLRSYKIKDLNNEISVRKTIKPSTAFSYTSIISSIYIEIQLSITQIKTKC